MRVLAKFIGFIVSLPFKYDNCSNIIVDEKQIALRNVVSTFKYIINIFIVFGY